MKKRYAYAISWTAIALPIIGFAILMPGCGSRYLEPEPGTTDGGNDTRGTGGTIGTGGSTSPWGSGGSTTGTGGTGGVVTIAHPKWAANVTGSANVLDVNADYCKGVDTAIFLGDCAAVNISYTAGVNVNKVSSPVFPNGAFRYTYNGANPANCAVTLRGCKNTDEAVTTTGCDPDWADYGCKNKVGPMTHLGGDFVSCSDVNGNPSSDCHLQVMFIPGQVPQPRGNNP